MGVARMMVVVDGHVKRLRPVRFESVEDICHYSNAIQICYSNLNTLEVVVVGGGGGGCAWKLCRRPY